MNFKKFLKYFVIVLIVGCSIGGAFYFFYANLRLNQDSFSAVNEFVYGGGKSEFDSAVSNVYGNYVNSANNDTRIQYYVDVNNQLGEIAKTLNMYFIDMDEYDLDGYTVVKYLDELLTQQDELTQMIEEYILHCDSSAFARNTGANDLVKGLYDYIVTYCRVLSTMNTEIKTKVVAGNNSDIKFDVIEIYLNICINTFSTTSYDTSGWLRLSNTDNYSVIYNKFNLENGIIQTGTTYGNFSYLNNLFITNYENCDTAAFAKSFSTNLGLYNSISSGSSSLVKAVYYFKQIFGIS